MGKSIGLGMLIIGAAATIASAGEGQTQSLAVDPSMGQGVHVITSQSTTQVKLATQIISMDRSANYNHQDGAVGSIDENHWIMKAQRIANAVAGESTSSVQIFYGDPDQPRGRAHIEPHMILLKPPSMRKNEPGKQIDSPGVPKSPEAVTPNKVAMAK